MHVMGLRLARDVASGGQHLGRSGHGLGARAQRLRIGERGELTREAGVPRAQALGVSGEAAELGDRPRRRGAHVARTEQRLAPVDGQLGARGVGVAETIERAPEQVRGRLEVVARERPPASRREGPPRPLAERAAVRIERAQLTQVLVRLLEVPADRLLVLDRPAGARLEPVGEAGVQLCARAAQHAAVGGVADQRVVEAERRLAEQPAGVGLDQLAPAQRLEPRVEVGVRLARQQVRHGRARELAPDHRRALQHQALLGAETLDARCEQRLDGGRHLELGEIDRERPALTVPEQRSVVHQHADQLADEEGVALARREHPACDRRGQRLGADHVRGEAHGGARVETAERHHLADQAARGRERGARLAQLRTRRHEHEQRDARPPLHQVLGEVEQERLGPLEVVDREHDGPLRGERGEQAPHHEEDLLGQGRRAGEQGVHPDGELGALGVVARDDEGVERRAQGCVVRARLEREARAERLRERREGGATGGAALGRENARATFELPRELGKEPRLAEPRRAEQHGQAGCGCAGRRVVDRREAPQLVVATHERSRRGAHGPLERHHAVRRHGLRPALEREASDALQRHPLRDQALGRLADQHVAVLRLLLEARCDVQRIADAGGVVVAHHDLAGVDRDPEPDPARELAVLPEERAEGALDLHGGAHRA